MLALVATFFIAAGPCHARGAEFRIVEVQTAAPTVLVLLLESGPHYERGAVSLPDLEPSHFAVNGQAPGAVHLYSVPWNEDKKTDKDTFPVSIRHHVYLVLKQPLEEGKTYRVTSPYGATALQFTSHRARCESIKVNQVGYNARATSRFANLGVYLGDGGSMRFDPPPMYDVVDEGNGRVVASGQARFIADDTQRSGITSGEYVYRLPLDGVPPGGPYFVAVRGFGRSWSFGVGDRYSQQIAKVVTRALYHQRCGIALEEPFTHYTRAACHTKLAYGTREPWADGRQLRVPPGAQLSPVSGGYHDAGDFDRRPMHTIIPILMFAYFEGFRSHFIDGQYSIPESGNGIPDFLDEALWGTKIWEALQITNPEDRLRGAVMAGTETDHEPAYGIDSAANDRGIYGTWSVLEAHTALAAGIFAQAARLVRPFAAKRADELLERGQLAWSYLERTADVHAPRTHFMYAALQLYLATGRQEYHDIFKLAAKAIVTSGGQWPEQYLPGNIEARCQTAHFVSYLLARNKPVDPKLASELTAQILHYAAAGTYMGPPPETQPYPQGATRFLGWGSGTAQGRYADVYAFATLFVGDRQKEQAYFNAVSQYADYALGLNPMGMSYFTGLGSVQPTSPLHLDSYFTKYGLSDGVTHDHAGHPIGNVPGILIYGPSEGRSGTPYQRAVSDKLYPAWDNLPAQRRFANGWSLVNSNEFSTWETIVWAVAMHGVLYDASADANAGSQPKTATPSK